MDYFVKEILEKLFILACFNKDKGNDTSRGKNLFSSKTKTDKTYSLDFYLLLLEMYESWTEHGKLKKNRKIVS